MAPAASTSPDGPVAAGENPGLGASRIPVSLVTGFLGSGKTTLIAALLRQPGMQGTAIIVNEIGAIGIDDAIFADTLPASDVRLLANGCMCCAAGDDLATTIWRMVTRTERPRRIIIETSGLADPASALRRLMGDVRLRQAIRLDAVIATVDGVNGSRDLDAQPVAMRQGAFADRRLITKADLAEPAEVAALAEQLKSLNPGAPVEVVANGVIDAARLFGLSLISPETGRADLDRWLNLEPYRARPLGRTVFRDIHFTGGPAHDASVGTWLIEERRPVVWENLSPRLGEIFARYGDSLLRLKGVIWTADDDRPLVIHGVQQLFHRPVRLQRWSRPPATSIVAIGDHGAAPAIELIADALATSATGLSADEPRPRRKASEALELVTEGKR
jgi:G3E family GTPase